MNRFIVPLLIVGSFLILFGKTLFPDAGMMIYGGDITDAYFYWRTYLRESMHDGVIPFWNPYNFSGTPFLAHPNMSLFYLPNWLFILLPPSFSFAFYFFVHLCIAAFSMYILSRTYASRMNACVAGIVYACGGFFVARVYSGHLEYVDAAAWMPLIFYFTRRVIREPTWDHILPAVLVWSQLFLAGNDLFILFTAELCGLYFLFHVAQTWRRNKISNMFFVRTVGVLILLFLLTIGLSSVHVLPKMQFVVNSLRATGLPYTLAGSGSLPLSGLSLFISPFSWGNPFPTQYSYHGPWPNLFEYLYYVGVLPPILVGFALIFFRHKVPSDFWFFVLFAIPLFLWISVGIYAPFNIHELLWSVSPFYKGIRFPARHLILVAFSLSVTTAMILEKIPHKYIRTLLLVFLVFDLLSFGKQFFQLTALPTAGIDQTLVELFTKDKEIFRVMPDYAVVSSVRKDFDFGAAAVFGIQTTSDYNSMMLGDYYDFIDILNQSKASSIPFHNVEIPPPDPLSPLVNFLNVRFVLHDKTLVQRTFPKEKYQHIHGAARYDVYENKEVQPRFFLVGKARLMDSQEEVARMLRTEPAIVSDTVLLEKRSLPSFLAQEDFGCPAEHRGSIDIVSYAPNEIRLTADVVCTSFLSSSEVYFPGWVATVDGKESQIFRSNFAFRSLFLPAGKHTILFSYRPTIFLLGLGISIGTVAITIFLWKNSGK